MRNHKTVGLLSFFSIIFFMVSANAENYDVLQVRKKNYIRAAIGYSYPHDKHGFRYHTHTKGAFLGSIGFGYIINSRFKADVTASYSEYKYANLGKITSGDANHNVVNPLSPLKERIRAYEFLIGCSFKFN